MSVTITEPNKTDAKFKFVTPFAPETFRSSWKGGARTHTQTHTHRTHTHTYTRANGMIYDMAQGTKDAATTTTTTASSVGRTFAWQECQCQVAILHAWCRLSLAQRRRQPSLCAEVPA